MVRGRYEFAICNDEEVIWLKVDGDYVTRILIVCLYCLLFFFISGNVLNNLDFFRALMMKHLFQLFL